MLSYRIEGERPPLLLIHGWGITYTIWRNLAPLLAPHFKLIMVELPGHGASPWPTQLPYFAACTASLEELRQHLQIERCHVLSYSVGAWAGRSYYECHPQRVDKPAPTPLNAHDVFLHGHHGAPLLAHAEIALQVRAGLKWFGLRGGAAALAALPTDREFVEN